MNSVHINGRLTQAPDVRYTKNGKAVASFTVAVSRGQERETTDFIPVVAWGSLAETSGNNLDKGSKVFVEGRLQIRSYETADGQKKRVAEVVANFISQSIESEKGQKVDFGKFGQDVDEPIPF